MVRTILICGGIKDVPPEVSPRVAAARERQSLAQGLLKEAGRLRTLKLERIDSYSHAEDENCEKKQALSTATLSFSKVDGRVNHYK
jgi:hypothetical protein